MNSGVNNSPERCPGLSTQCSLRVEPATHHISRLAFLFLLEVQRAILSPFFLLDTTAPFTRCPRSICSPIRDSSCTNEEQQS